MNNVEQMVSKLQLLAAKQNLMPAENEEAQSLMQQLKAAGLSNAEITAVCKDKWSPSTIKGYTAGFNAPSPNQWEDAVSVLTDLVAQNLSLHEVKEVLAAMQQMAKCHVNIGDLSTFLQTAAASGVEAAKLLKEAKLLHAEGKSLREAAEYSSLKKQVELSGLSLAALAPLAKLAQKHGEAQQVMEALTGFNSLQEVEEKLNHTQKEADKKKAELADSKQQLAELNKKYLQLQQGIEAYQTVQKMGFYESTLKNLSTLNSSYGGTNMVIEGMKKYKDLEDLKYNVKQEEAKLEQYRAQSSSEMMKYNHLITAITMCQTLIADHGLGPDAVKTIYQLAKKFGTPSDVLKAVELYGSMADIEKRLAEQNGNLEKRQQFLAQLEGEIKEADDRIKEFYGVVLEMGKKAASVQAEIDNSHEMRLLLDFMQRPGLVQSDEYIPVITRLTISLLHWVKANSSRFLYIGNIQSSLNGMLSSLGGTAS